MTKRKDKPRLEPIPEVRHAFQRRRFPTIITGESRTIQEFKDECDINRIIRHYSQTGMISHVNRRKPIFADVPNLDFGEALNIVLEGKEAFSQLPSDVRRRFNNDPAEMLEFCSDLGNLAEMAELGLIPQERVEVSTPPIEPLAAPQEPSGE